MGFFRSFKRLNYSLLFGICLGMVLTLMQTPMINEDCSGENTFTFLDEKSHNFRDLRSHDRSPKSLEVLSKGILNSNQVIQESKTKEDESLQPVVRPRFYSAELEFKDKLLVSVLSSMDSIDSFGIAINETVRHYVDKLLFFIDGLGDKELNINLPIVGFRDSKPQLKIYRILSYIGENFLSKYDFFFFITDHSYINGNRLSKMLQHMSISQNVHMGVLSEELDSNFCSLDSGIVLSQGLLREFFLQLKWCVQHVDSPHHDNKFGKCVLHSTKMPCSSNAQSLTYKSYKIQDNLDVQTHLQLVGANTLIKEAVTFSGLQNSDDIYKLHLFYLQKRAYTVIDEVQSIRKDMEETDLSHLVKKGTKWWPIGSLKANSPPTRHDVIRWETFNATHILLPSDFQNVKRIVGADLLDIMNVVNASVSFLKTKLSIPVTLKEIEYGYRRFDPTRGMDYFLLLTLKDAITGKSLHKRIKGFRGLTMPEFIHMPYVTEDKPVTLLIFVTEEDVRESIEFMERLEKFNEIEQLTLLFTLITKRKNSKQSSNDLFKSLKKRTETFTNKYYETESRASWNTFHIDGEKPHPIAILDLVFRKLGGDTLIALLDPTAQIGSDFLNRVCLNTIQKCQVFSPIPFIMYHPQAVEDARLYATNTIHRRNGHFDKYSYDIISFYISDYLSARKSYLKMIPPIRSEKELRSLKYASLSLSLYRMFLTSKLNVLRAVEPELLLSYSKVICSENLNATDKMTCLQRRALSYGMKDQLSKLVIENERS